MTRSSLLRYVLFAGLICLVASGCGGGSPRTVKGKLVLAPGIKLAPTDSVNLTFVPEAKNGTTAVADVSAADMTFSVKVPSGKYKVAFAITPYPGEKGSEKRAEAFATINKAFDPNSTTMTYEVTSDNVQDVTVDLAQGRITKN